MVINPSKEFGQILDRVSALPVIDTHEHMVGPQFSVPITEPITALTLGYLQNDLISTGAEAEDIFVLQDPEVSTEAKWPVFEPLWKAVEHTTNAHITKLIMKDYFGQDEMSLAALSRIAENMHLFHDEETYWKILDDAGIQLIISDPLGRPQGDFGGFLRGDLTYPERFRIMISLPLFHVVAHHPQSARDWEGLQQIGAWASKHITSLEEFLESVFDIFIKAKDNIVLHIR